MKAVMPSVSPEIVDRRKRLGLDKWDEMWEGVLHVPPMPHFDHQDLEVALQIYLWQNWAQPNKAKVLHQMNLASIDGWPHDYRIPDIVLLTPERFDINKGEYFEGAPDVVIEIRSPGDETEEKMPFYAELRVPEVWIIDRDTKEPEILVLKKGRYRRQRAVKGRVRSPATGIEMRASKAGKLMIRLAGDESTQEELPGD